MNGTLAILSVGEGDLKISFNPKNPGDKKAQGESV